MTRRMDMPAWPALVLAAAGLLWGGRHFLRTRQRRAPRPCAVGEPTTAE